MSKYSSSGRDGYPTYRRLGITGKRGWATLDSYEVGSDLEVFGGLSSAPLFAPHTDEAAALGRSLSQITGWPLL